MLVEHTGLFHQRPDCRAPNGYPRKVSLTLLSGFFSRSFTLPGRCKGCHHGAGTADSPKSLSTCTLDVTRRPKESYDNPALLFFMLCRRGRTSVQSATTPVPAGPAHRHMISPGRRLPRRAAGADPHETGFSNHETFARCERDTPAGSGRRISIALPREPAHQARGTPLACSANSARCTAGGRTLRHALTDSAVYPALSVQDYACRPQFKNVNTLSMGNFPPHRAPQFCGTITL